MKARDLPGLLDRTQHARWFKVAATVAFLLVVALAYGWYAVGVASGKFGGAESVLGTLEGFGEAAKDDPEFRLVEGVLERASSSASVGVGAAVAALVGVVVIWLGLGLTYLGLGLVAAAIGVPLFLFEPTEVYARLLFGVLVLSASFTALMQALRALFSGSGPVVGVARNMLTEAVRLKISLVLIILLILGLAVLPGILDQDQPLRYRVQSFFQYSVSGSFWVIAVLTLAFGVSSITSEQRDKVIWQTVTKPVAAWQYLLGKWIGLISLNAILLLVCASGIFLFAEYLRHQPAVGERQAYISDDAAITEDRFILETRVLSARRSAFLDIPDELRIDHPEFLARVESYIERERLTDPDLATTPEEYAKVVSDLNKGALRVYQSIPAGDRRDYRISGLGEAVARQSPMTLSIRIDAQGNRPDLFYTLSFVFPNAADPGPYVRQMGLGFIHNLPLPPDAVTPDGVLDVQVWNGRLVLDPSGAIGIAPNPSAATIPDRALEVSYAAGGYRMNFMRVVLVLWIKLAVLAMVAVFAATFLSFPVACLVSFGVFLLAEMSGFLVDAAEAYGVTGKRGEFVWYKWVTSGLTEFMGQLFAVYGDLDPVKRLVDGRLMAWSSVGAGAGALIVATGLLFALSVFVFRRRELAIYSGQ
jgi:ABC-type transport system involved in multi-copper enzyme maturation permease subunit